MNKYELINESWATMNKIIVFGKNCHGKMIEKRYVVRFGRNSNI